MDPAGWPRDVGEIFVLQTQAQSNEADDATSTSKWRSLWRAWVGQASPLWTLGFALVVLLPAIDNWIQRSLLGLSGEATELVWLAMLQYAALWSASFAKDAKQHWIVLLISSFLMLFGLSTSDRRDIGYLVGIYGLMVAWWLMARHWEKLERGFVAVDSVPLLRMRVLAIASIAICVVLLGLFVVPRTSMTHALDGFMPTSGGKQTADSAARNGVGDGDMLVAAKDEAFTFGPVDSDLFLESTMPSLYDMVSDIYGTPKFKKRKVQKAVALDAKMKETSQEGTESKKSGREFSTFEMQFSRTLRFVPKAPPVAPSPTSSVEFPNIFVWSLLIPSTEPIGLVPKRYHRPHRCRPQPWKSTPANHGYAFRTCRATLCIRPANECGEDDRSADSARSRPIAAHPCAHRSFESRRLLRLDRRWSISNGRP